VGKRERADDVPLNAQGKNQPRPGSHPAQEREVLFIVRRALEEVGAGFGRQLWLGCSEHMGVAMR
jgi:hypothetical protein